MRKSGNHLNRFRVDHPMQSPKNELYGGFVIPLKTGARCFVMSSGTDKDDKWEHVSVSLHNRCPTWDEMCEIKALFWTENETVIQFHPKKTQYVNTHPFCLHLWKRTDSEIELPPTVAV